MDSILSTALRERNVAREARRQELQDTEGKQRTLQSVMDRLHHHDRQLEAFARGGALDLARAEEAVQRLRQEQESVTQEIAVRGAR